MSCYDRLAVLQNVFASFLLIARKGVEKLFEETAYKEDKEKKEEAETKRSAWDLKILEQSSGTRQACVSVYFLNF